MKKVSVIVPVYKTEKYIAECLESLISQTLADIEIIVLNDGSPDNSESIILDYAGKDERIRYFRHENSGITATRNRGITEAEGEYLSFVDSDDYIEPDMLEVLYAKAVVADADVACCEVYRETAGGSRIRKDLSGLGTVDIKEISVDSFYREYFFRRFFSVEVWNKIYRADFIRGNGICFGDSRVSYAEDGIFNFWVAASGARIVFVDKPLYHNRIRENSVMTSKQKNLPVRLVRAYDFLEEAVVAGNTELQKAADVKFFNWLMIAVVNVTDSGGSFRELRGEMKVFYDSRCYRFFLESAGRNRSFSLLANPKRRFFMRLCLPLFRTGITLPAEAFFYFRCKYLR